MFDLSPEKLMVLLTLGLVVLGPNRLPGAARGLAHGLARARQLAGQLTDPVRTNLTEPLVAGLAESRQIVTETAADLRSAVVPRTASEHIHPQPGPDPLDPSLN